MSEQKPYTEFSEKIDSDSHNHADESLSENSKEAPGYDEEYSPAEQSKIIHRVDRRLISTCGILYCISLMDRTNLSAAALAGMTAELRLNVGFRYVGMACHDAVSVLTQRRAP